MKALTVFLSLVFAASAYADLEIQTNDYEPIERSTVAVTDPYHTEQVILSDLDDTEATSERTFRARLKDRPEALKLEVPNTGFGENIH